MRILIFFIVLSNLVFAQYDSTMFDLTKTTYERSFDKQILHKYLNSNIDKKIKAALLSAAHSEDTSFVAELLKLDLNKYGSEVCFALAQIGECNQSINFLWNYLHSSPPPYQFSKIFYSIGKIGNGNDLKKLIEFYNSFDGPSFPYQGISEAILQFQIRGIKNDSCIFILEQEILSPLSDKDRVTKALFVLSRLGSLKNILRKLVQIISEKSSSVILKQYALLNLQRLKLCPISPETLKNILSERDDLVRIEAVKTSAYYNFNKDTTEVFKTFISLLEDENLNVTIEAAKSLRLISFDESTIEKSSLKKVLANAINLAQNEIFKGELFLTYTFLFGSDDLISKLIDERSISKSYIAAHLSTLPFSEKVLDRILDLYEESTSLKEKILIFEKIVPYSNLRLKRVDLLMTSALEGDIAPLISSAADGIDSSFISANTIKLEQIIQFQIDKYKDNPDYLEATMSLIKLSEKIDNNFYEMIIDKVKSSELYSIRKFAASKTGSNQFGFKELDKFEDIWKYAFKYKQALIKTSKGEIRIELLSELAPISTGNFCKLAEEEFYNGIMFHRVVPGFVIQAGDPTATGWGGPGYDIVSEFSDTDFGIGYVGMASAGKDTESSQFFVMQGSHPHLNGRYTVFAKVIEGMDIVYKITEDDKIISINLE